MATADQPAWEIPAPNSVYAAPMDDGEVIHLRRHGNPNGPRLVLSHGNGLSIDLYYPFWSLLVDDFDIVVYDLRNHGWNSIGDISSHSIPMFIRDHDRILKLIDEKWGERPKIGVYHSVSALASLLSFATAHPLSARVLIDPPLCKPGLSYEEFDAASTRTAALIRRRSSRFESAEEFTELHHYLPTFYRAMPGVIDLAASSTLRESESREGVELRCPPEYEAKILDYVRVFASVVDLQMAEGPVKVIGADPTLPYSFLPSFDFSDFDLVNYDFVPETTHLLQLEKPETVVAYMMDFLKSEGLI